MRRLLTGILAALILLTLAACGSEKTDAGNDGKEEDSATVNGVVNLRERNCIFEVDL